jgi:signal peptidase I
MPGDFVMINKQIPGPRIFKSWDFLNGDFTMKRLGGYRKIRRNEVIVFNFPYSNHYKLDLDFNVFYAKRCVAVAGDTFYIDNGIYRVKNCCDTLGYYENQLKVSQMESEQDAKSGTWNCFPYDTVYYKWNIKNFGPLYVPAANDTLSIDSLNIKLYKNLIEYETSQEISVVNGTVLLGGDTLNRYIFLKNYYFVTGDYAPDSHDSRYWGLLPEDHIAGKAFIIWKSQDRNTGKYNWKRFFKSL